MAIKIYWDLSTDSSVTSYLVQSGSSYSGTFQTISTVSNNTGSNWDSVAGQFFYTDNFGTASSWYQVLAKDGSNQTSAATPPFQPGPVDSNLATLGDLKSYLGKTDTADDALLARLLAVSSDWFRSATGREFIVRDLIETRNGNGGRSMSLLNDPVRAVRSVAVDGTTVATTSWTSNGQTVYLTDGTVFTEDLQNVVISYTAGFYEIPADIQQAVIELAAIKFRERQHVGSASTTLAGTSVSFLPAIIPQSIKDVVDSYRRVSI